MEVRCPYCREEGSIEIKQFGPDAPRPTAFLYPCGVHVITVSDNSYIEDSLGEIRQSLQILATALQKILNAP